MEFGAKDFVSFFAAREADEVALVAADGDVFRRSNEQAMLCLLRYKALGVPLVVGWRTDSAGLTPWQDFLAGGRDVEPPTHQAPRPYLHYTSGTTGRPKGAVTPPNMFPATATVAEFFQALREQVALAAPGPGLAVGEREL